MPSLLAAVMMKGPDARELRDVGAAHGQELVALVDGDVLEVVRGQERLRDATPASRRSSCSELMAVERPSSETSMDLTYWFSGA